MCLWGVDMDKHDVKFLAVFVTAISLAIVLIVIVSEIVGQYQCNNYQDITGRESKWVFIDACYVKGDGGKWIRYDSAYKE